MILKKGFALLLLAIAILAAGFLNALAQDFNFTSKSPEALQYLQQGIEKNDAFAFNEANALFEKAIKADPECAIAYYFSSLTAVNNDDFLKKINKAVELSGNSSEPEKMLILAQKNIIDGRADLARGHFNKLIEYLPESPRAHYYYGGFLYGQGDWANAEKEFRKSTELNPDYAIAYNMLAYTLSNENKYQNAIIALQKYAELRPNEPNPHDSMGEIYLWMDDHNNSIGEYTKSLEKNPKFVLSLAGIGHNYLFMGDFERARQHYDKLMAQAQSVADTNTSYYWKATSFSHEKKHNKSIDVLKDQLKFARSHNDIYSEIGIHGQMAEIYRETGDLENALREARKEHEMAQRPEIDKGLADGFIRDADFTEAIVLTRQQKDKMAEARVEDYKKSVEAANNINLIESCHALLGVVAFWKKDYRTAANELVQADPNDQYAKYYLAMTYEKTDKLAEAKKLFAEITNFNQNSLTYSLVRSVAMGKI